MVDILHLPRREFRPDEYIKKRYDKDDYDESVDAEGSDSRIWRVPKRPEHVAKMVGRRIRQLRKAKSWSQEYLADEAGVHRTYMWGIEQGLRNPSLKHLTRIADALHVPLATLFEGV